MRGATARAIRRRIYEDGSPRFREYTPIFHRKPTGKVDANGKPVMIRVETREADKRRQLYQRAKRTHSRRTAWA